MAAGGPADGRMTDDDGGIWIVAGWVAGLLVYAGLVLMAVAGFSAVIPFVVVPPVLLALVGAGNLLGGRTHGRAAGRAGGGRVPLSVSGSGAAPPDHGPEVTDAAEEAGSPP